MTQSLHNDPLWKRLEGHYPVIEYLSLVIISYRGSSIEDEEFSYRLNKS